MRNLLILIVLVGLVLWLAVFRKPPAMEVRTPSYNSTSTATTTATSTSGRVMSVEDFIRSNISDLSNASGTVEVLGGKFYVTKIEAKDGKGTVYYEDGHIAKVADFTYSVSETGIKINSFKVRP